MPSSPVLNPVYSTGLVAATAGTSTIALTGGAWTDMQVGDILLVAGLYINSVSEVAEDFSSAAVNLPWPADFSGATYAQMRISAKRFDALEVSPQLAAVLSALRLRNTPYLLASDEAAPDPGVGTDGQPAWRINGSIISLWVKAAGVWEFQGTSGIGLNPKGAWSSATTYAPGDYVTRLGSSYTALLAGTNKAPESNDDYWMLSASSGGRYDIAAWDNYMPASGETIAKMVLTTAVTFPAGLVESQGKADVAATADAVFSVKKNGTEFGTVTFAAASASAAFAAAVQTVFAAGDVLTVVAPNPRDATLSGISLTLTGYR